MNNFCLEFEKLWFRLQIVQRERERVKFRTLDEKKAMMKETFKFEELTQYR